MSLPHFLGIGAQKCATSWLWVQLLEHPDVWMPPVKELHYFDHLYCEENRKWTTGHIENSVRQALKWHISKDKLGDLSFYRYMIDLATEELFTEGWYERAFDRPGAKDKLLGDITPEYCTIPKEGVEHAKELLGADLKIIMLIRDPIDRAISQIRMNASRQGKELNKKTESWVPFIDDPAILNRGDYRHSIETWGSVYPESSFLYLPFGKVKSDPQDLMKEVEDFLEIPHHDYSKLSQVVHKTSDQTPAPKKVKDKLLETLAPQNDFLIRELGQEFYQATV